MVEDNLQDINTKLAAARTDQIRLEGQLQQLDQIGNNIDALLALPVVSAAPMVADARAKIIQIEAGIATLALRYKDKHPRMMAAKASLAEAKTSSVKRSWRNLRFCAIRSIKPKRHRPTCNKLSKPSRASRSI